MCELILFYFVSDDSFDKYNEKHFILLKRKYAFAWIMLMMEHPLFTCQICRVTYNVLK